MPFSGSVARLGMKKHKQKLEQWQNHSEWYPGYYFQEIFLGYYHVIFSCPYIVHQSWVNGIKKKPIVKLSRQKRGKVDRQKGQYIAYVNFSQL